MVASAFGGKDPSVAAHRERTCFWRTSKC